MSKNISDLFKSSVRTNQRLNENEIKSLDDLKCLINVKIDSKEKSIVEHRIKLNGSRGVWRSDLRIVEVIQNRNINQFMGFTISSIKYLNPFEALYLMETQSMEVLFEDIPLSIEQSFQLFFENQNQIDFYRIYALLSRNGYFVKSHQKSEANESVVNRKRNLSDSDIDCDKRFVSDINYYELSEKIANYKSIENIRALRMDLLPKTLISQTFIESKDNQKSSNDSKSFCKQSVIYEIKDNESPVELDSSLTLYNGNIKPLCDFGSVLSTNDLFDLIQSFGPKCKTSEAISDSKFELILDVFRHENNKLDEMPYFHVILTQPNQPVPQIKELRDLEQKIGSKRIYFAVIDSIDITFYSVSQIDLNEEFPLFWQKYLKPL